MRFEGKFLAIKNWDKYQPKDSKNLPWIRDYKDKEFDPEYSRLTILQRYILDAICRLRGRYGRNIPNDPLWICRATAVLPRERHNATTAIQQLISSGFLVLTNEQDAPLGKVRKGEERKEIDTVSGSSEASPEGQKEVIEMDRYSAGNTLGLLIGLSGTKTNIETLMSAIDQGKRRWPDLKREEVAEKITELWKEYISQPTHIKQSLRNWLDAVGSYIDSQYWKVERPEEFKPQIDWQGGYVGPDGVYVNKRGQRVPGFICPPNPNGKGADA